MNGKSRCKILKEIRQKIADENDIPYVTRECTFQGECKGTCPTCEKELKYLEDELEKRKSLGKKVAVAAVAAGVALTSAGCTRAVNPLEPVIRKLFPDSGANIENLPGEIEVVGDVPYEIVGKMTYDEQGEEPDITEDLGGYVAEPEIVGIVPDERY